MREATTNEALFSRLWAGSQHGGQVETMLVKVNGKFGGKNMQLWLSLYLYFPFLILSLPSCTYLSTYYVPGNAPATAIAPLRPDIEPFPSGT